MPPDPRASIITDGKEFTNSKSRVTQAAFISQREVKDLPTDFQILSQYELTDGTWGGMITVKSRKLLSVWIKTIPDTRFFQPPNPHKTQELKRVEEPNPDPIKSTVKKAINRMEGFINRDQGTPGGYRRILEASGGINTPDVDEVTRDRFNKNLRQIHLRHFKADLEKEQQATKRLRAILMPAKV